MKKPDQTVLLSFNPADNELSPGKQLRDGLSVALQIGDTLWLANDESISLERLRLVPSRAGAGRVQAREHVQFSLADYLQLPVMPGPDPADIEEVDVEGLAYADGYLWLTGSHSRKRGKPDEEDDAKTARAQLAEVSDDGNRYLIARIPVVLQAGQPALAREHRDPTGRRTAAVLRRDGAGGNELTRLLRRDKHLGPYLAIPGKDNGFDIEGLAVVGPRLFLGLRGPVLRGWAVILEIEPVVQKGSKDVLKLAAVTRKGRRYRKHFLQLGGLGVRDLCVQDDDLLILAGPTMSLDGPVRVLHWPGGARAQEECVVRAEELQPVLEVPYGQGEDHAEGLCLFASDTGRPPALLVVYDSAGAHRKPGDSEALADVFPLPRPRRQ